jgi:hypothetical protein
MEIPQKRRFYFEGENLVDSPLSTQNTTWKTPPTTHKKKNSDNPSLHGTLLIGCMEIQFLKLGVTIFGLNFPPSHVQLFHVTFLWHASTP